MDVYVTEQEQLEAIKRWCRDNGLAVIVGLVLGLGGLFGWRYWQAYQAGRAVQASIGYQDLIASALGDDNDRAQALAHKLVTDASDRAYGSLAALMLARLAVDAGKPAEAEAHLQSVLNHPRPVAIATVARLRLARLELGRGDTDSAWTRVQDLPALADQSAYHELRGDILVAQGKREEARREYQRGLDIATKQQLDPSLLELKLDDLGTVLAPETSP